jgi:hypothetical protein
MRARGTPFKIRPTCLLGFDVRLAVISAGEVHALVFPCQHEDVRWVDAVTGRTVDVHPTHWQHWAQQRTLELENLRCTKDWD